MEALSETPRDCFGNAYAEDLPYARGAFVRGTADDIAKLEQAWRILNERIANQGLEAVYNFSGLDRHLVVEPEDLPYLDDELAPARYSDELRRLGLEHLGGDPTRHDVFTLNRLTGALLLGAEVLVSPGDEVIGVSPRYSHPAVRRAVNRARGTFTDVVGAKGLRDAGSFGALLYGDRA
jgi:L-seryl-tRNA(Ser) seleniumtransferase